MCFILYPIYPYEHEYTALKMLECGFGLHSSTATAPQGQMWKKSAAYCWHSPRWAFAVLRSSFFEGRSEAEGL